jgi:hypothetical protein
MNKIEKGYMGFAEGMAFGLTQSRSNGMKQVDWSKAKQFTEENNGRLGILNYQGDK